MDGLPDIDKRANFYVEVNGYYEFGDQVNHRHTVPKIKDFRGSSTLPFLLLCRACFCLIAPFPLTVSPFCRPQGHHEEFVCHIF